MGVVYVMQYTSTEADEKCELRVNVLLFCEQSTDDDPHLTYLAKYSSSKWHKHGKENEKYHKNINLFILSTP